MNKLDIIDFIIKNQIQKIKISALIGCLTVLTRNCNNKIWINPFLSKLMLMKLMVIYK